MSARVQKLARQLATAEPKRPGIDVTAMIELALALDEAGRGGGPAGLVAAAVVAAHAAGMSKEEVLEQVGSCYDLCVADEIRKVGS